MKKLWSLLFFAGAFNAALVVAQNTDNAVPSAGESDATTANVVKKEENLWKTLSKITFRKQYDELMGFKIDVPVFSESIQALDGKEVTIKGYIIPVEGYKGHKEFILSAFPYNMCFFCGGAGPETVMEVTAKEAIEYSAEAVTIKGKLALNSDDINRLMYGLTDAVLVKE